ncbi:MAG TPA: metalloregulator ArsR/SmtB family transcription factor [Candidatus Paceibacterota bacterium]
MLFGDKKRTTETERILRALGNNRRLLIVQLLHKEGSLPVGTVAEKIQLSFTSTSKHLRILAHANVVESKQTSTTVQYSLPKQRHPILIATLKTA